MDELERISRKHRIAVDGKPDWTEAPEWAKWLAQDSDGSWWWFENEPHLDTGAWFSTRSMVELARDSIQTPLTVERRP